MVCTWPDVEIKYEAWQVVEIEELNGNAVEENQSLKERISELQELIKELEKSSSLAITSEEQAKVCSVSFSYSGCMSCITFNPGF